MHNSSRRLSLCLLLAVLALVPACSYMLDAVANPDAPTFALEVVPEGSGLRLSWDASGISTAKPDDKDSLGQPRDWEMLYGYYVFAASETPYDGYVLVGRLLNSAVLSRTWSSTVWSVSGNKMVDVPVTVIPTGAPASQDLANTFFIDDMYGYKYYRVAIIVLERTVTVKRDENDEKLGTEIIYKLRSHDVSGWGARP